jgi:hypothetical protein
MAQILKHAAKTVCANHKNALDMKTNRDRALLDLEETLHLPNVHVEHCH